MEATAARYLATGEPAFVLKVDAQRESVYKIKKIEKQQLLSD